MKKLTIKGHATRGKEVIELLEMMGGKNKYHYKGFEPCIGFTVEIDGNICRVMYDFHDEFVFFSLEEFLEKYPFKVGDNVEVRGTRKVFTIGNMVWEDELCTVHYVDMEDIEYYMANELKPYKETNMNVEFDLTKYSYEVKDGKLIIEEKKPKYPKTYKECCDVLLIPPYYNLRYHTYERGYNEYATSNTLLSLGDKLNTYGKLLICRDAYWKIAGKEMGLGKPWEPDWKSDSKKKYCLSCNGGNINKYTWCLYNSILAFPTEEMRDTFYENFKDLIEECKELL